MNKQRKIISSILFIAILSAYFLLSKNSQISTNIAYTQRISADLSAQKEGTLVKLNVNEGQVVMEGEVLLSLSNDAWLNKERELRHRKENLTLSLQHTESTFSLIQKQKRTLESQREKTASSVARTRNRLSELNKISSAISEYDKDPLWLTLHQQTQNILELERKIEALNIELAIASQSITRNHQHLEQIDADIAWHNSVKDRYSIVASHPGKIAKIHAYPGDHVTPGEPVLTLVSQRSPAHIDAYFIEHHLHALQQGTPVSIVIDAYPEQIFKGRVSHVFPLAGASINGDYPNYSSGSFTRIAQKAKLRIDFSEPATLPKDLPAGLSATVMVSEESEH